MDLGGMVELDIRRYGAEPLVMGPEPPEVDEPWCSVWLSLRSFFGRPAAMVANKMK